MPPRRRNEGRALPVTLRLAAEFPVDVEGHRFTGLVVEDELRAARPGRARRSPGLRCKRAKDREQERAVMFAHGYPLWAKIMRPSLKASQMPEHFLTEPK